MNPACAEKKKLESVIKPTSLINLWWFKVLLNMDYIKSWYEYFRGNTTNGSKENEIDVVKNEILKFENDKPPVVDNNPRETMGIESIADIMRIFFGDSEHYSNQSDISSDIYSSWGFGSDIFRTANEIHKEFLNHMNELHNEFPFMQNVIFQDNSDQNLAGCSNCDRPLLGENLREYYLRVPDLESVKSGDKYDKFGITNPVQDGGGMIVSEGPTNSMPHFHSIQQSVSVVVGSDGVLEITKITKDANGKSEKTVTKVDLKDKM